MVITAMCYLQRIRGMSSIYARLRPCGGFRLPVMHAALF
ncbi:hypothetical protein LCGC14_1098210, partial [marine sediment metagenome]